LNKKIILNNKIINSNQKIGASKLSMKSISMKATSILKNKETDTVFLEIVLAKFFIEENGKMIATTDLAFSIMKNQPTSKSNLTIEICL
jgi:hypothetical protein